MSNSQNMSNSQDVANAVGAIAEMAWIFYTAIRNAQKECLLKPAKQRSLVLEPGGAAKACL